MSRILVVDDDEVTRVRLGSLLKSWQHDVQYAPNGAVAINLYKRNPFDVCVVDLVMPVTNGLEAIKEIREMDADARIVAITGVSPDLNLDVATNLGAVQTLSKPVNPKDLRQAVLAALGQDATDGE
jgi:CheY-like chemotaxis protein